MEETTKIVYEPPFIDSLVTAIDFPVLLPPGASEESKASQLFKVAKRSPDRYVKPKIIRKKTPIEKTRVRFEEKTKGKREQKDVAKMKKLKEATKNKKNIALIAQLTNVKRAQEEFQKEREISKNKKEELEMAEKIRRGKAEKYNQWVNRNHKELNYLAGRGDINQMERLWNTFPRKLLLQFIDKPVDKGNDETILLWAAEKGKVASIQWLIDRGCDVYKKDSHGKNALLNACRNGHIGCVKYLIENYNFSPRLTMDNYENGMVIESIYSGRLDVFQFIHETYHLDLEKRNELQEVPFHIACSTGNIEICKYLLEQLVDPGLLGYDGKNAAHYAAQGNHTKILKFLNEHCPEVDFRGMDRFGKTPLYLCENENQDSTQMAKTIACIKACLRSKK
jgi:hypothetical protein